MLQLCQNHKSLFAFLKLKTQKHSIFFSTPTYEISVSATKWQWSQVVNKSEPHSIGHRNPWWWCVGTCDPRLTGITTSKTQFTVSQKQLSSFHVSTPLSPSPLCVNCKCNFPIFRVHSHLFLSLWNPCEFPFQPNIRHPYFSVSSTFFAWFWSSHSDFRKGPISPITFNSETHISISSQKPFLGRKKAASGSRKRDPFGGKMHFFDLWRPSSKTPNFSSTFFSWF